MRGEALILVVLCLSSKVTDALKRESLWFRLVGYLTRHQYPKSFHFKADNLPISLQNLTNNATIRNHSCTGSDGTEAQQGSR